MLTPNPLTSKLIANGAKSVKAPREISDEHGSGMKESADLFWLIIGLLFHLIGLLLYVIILFWHLTQTMLPIAQQSSPLLLAGLF